MKRHGCGWRVAFLCWGILTSSVVFGAELKLGEHGKTVEEGFDAGPTLIFPDARTAYISFFLENQNGSSTPVDVFVCYRRYGDGVRDKQADQTVSEKRRSGDDCLEQSNGWIRVAGVRVADQAISSGKGLGNGSGPWGFFKRSFRAWHYRAELHGLTPDALYEYRISRRSTSMFRYKTRVKLANRVVFRTPPVPGAAQGFDFVAMADLRSYDGPKQQALVRARLDELVSAGRADFVILPGDISNQVGASVQYYEHYFNFYERLTRFVPFYPVHGNHDLYAKGGGGENFFRMFDLPPNPAAESVVHRGLDGRPVSGFRSFYSFDWADTHFIALDVIDFPGRAGFDEYGPGSVQYQWLERDLAANQGARWRVVYFHEPPLGSSLEKPALRELMSLLARYRVHLVLNGHLEWPVVAVDQAVPVLVLPSGGSRARFAKQKFACELEGRHRFGLFAISVASERILIHGVNSLGARFAEVEITKDAAGRARAGVLKLANKGCESGVY